MGCASVSVSDPMPSSLPCLSPVCCLSVTRSVSPSVSASRCVCVCVCVCDKLKWTKELSGISKPGKVAYYSNTNIDLLAYIVEHITGKTLMEAYEEFIIYPLGLKNTYIPQDDKVYIPALYYDGRPLRRPNLIMSAYGSGGLISTSRELMKFLIAFFDGRLFNKSLIEKLTEFNSMENGYGNILYGGGLMKLKSKKVILGQFGFSGAFAFADPENRYYLTGYLAQSAGQQVLAKMVSEILEKN